MGFSSSVSADLSVSDEYFLSAFRRRVRKIERRMKMRMMKMMARMMPEMTPSRSWRCVLLLMMTMGLMWRVRAMVLENIGSPSSISSTRWLVYNMGLINIVIGTPCPGCRLQKGPSEGS